MILYGCNDDDIDDYGDQKLYRLIMIINLRFSSCIKQHIGKSTYRPLVILPHTHTQIEPWSLFFGKEKKNDRQIYHLFFSGDNFVYFHLTFNWQEWLCWQFVIIIININISNIYYCRKGKRKSSKHIKSAYYYYCC